MQLEKKHDFSEISALSFFLPIFVNQVLVLQDAKSSRDNDD